MSPAPTSVLANSHAARHYYSVAIRTFRDKVAAAAFMGLPVRDIPADLRRRARAKLEQIHHAATLQDLRVPPANHLERMQGNRSGQYSIRINDPWRVCFSWRDGDAFDVEIVDYH